MKELDDVILKGNSGDLSEVMTGEYEHRITEAMEQYNKEKYLNGEYDSVQNESMV